MRGSRVGVAALMIMGLFIAGCETHDGPAERMGENIDEAVEETGEAVEEGVEWTGEAIEEAGDEVRDATQ